MAGVGVGAAGLRRAAESKNFADSDPDPESQDINPQQTVILAENTERPEEKETGSFEIKLCVI